MLPGVNLLVLSLGTQGRLSFTSSIRVEILGENIVLVSIGKFTKKTNNALIKPVVYNF